MNPAWMKGVTPASTKASKRPSMIVQGVDGTAGFVLAIDAGRAPFQRRSPVAGGEEIVDADVDRAVVEGGEVGEQRAALGQRGVVGLVIAEPVPDRPEGAGGTAGVDAHPDGGRARLHDPYAVGGQAPSTKIASCGSSQSVTLTPTPGGRRAPPCPSRSGVGGALGGAGEQLARRELWWPSGRCPSPGRGLECVTLCPCWRLAPR